MRTNILWGLRWGLTFGLGFSAIGAIQGLVVGASLDSSFALIVFVYVSVATLMGGIIGLFRTHLDRPSRAAMMGASIALACSVAYAVFSGEVSRSTNFLTLAIVAAVPAIPGALMGWIIWRGLVEDKPFFTVGPSKPRNNDG